VNILGAGAVPVAQVGKPMDGTSGRRQVLRKTMTINARSATIALITLLAFGCSDDGEVQAPLQDITLDVRVHLLRSAGSGPLNATLDEVQIATLLEGVNAIWEPAGITWRVESVIDEPAENTADYERALRGETPLTIEIISAVIPRNMLSGGWDVFVINDLGNIAAGIYLGFIPAVLFAENGQIGAQAPDGIGPRVLAHELGHSLSLPHVPCTPAGNLMAPSCPAEDRTRLTVGQISAARAQASAGRPFGGG
jgi:hypothetical protein